MTYENINDFHAYLSKPTKASRNETSTHTVSGSLVCNHFQCSGTTILFLSGCCQKCRRLGPDQPIRHAGDPCRTLKAFPNPVSDILILETKTLHQSNTIVDVRGTIVESGTIDASPMELDFSHVAPGTSILQVDQEKTHLIVKHSSSLQQ